MKNLVGSFAALFVLLSIVNHCSGATCGNQIVESGEQCDVSAAWCVSCKYNPNVAAAITQQLETISGDPTLTVQLVTIMQYPYRPVNPRFILTGTLAITTLSTNVSPSGQGGRSCDDTYGSDCGQYWNFGWWMGNDCENPSGTYKIQWDIVCRNDTSCLPIQSFSGQGGKIIMDPATSTLTIQFILATTTDYCGGRDIEVPADYQLITYSDPAFSVPQSAFIQCRYIYLAINNVAGVAPSSMTVDILQISGGDYLIQGGVPQYADVNLTYNGPNAQVSFQGSIDRFPVPRNGVFKFSLFAHLALDYTKRTPTSSLLTGNATLSNCAGTCLADQCHIPPPLTTSSTATSSTTPATSTPDTSTPDTSTPSKVNGCSSQTPGGIVLLLLVALMGSFLFL